METKTESWTAGPWTAGAFQPSPRHAGCPQVGYILLWDGRRPNGWGFQPTKADARLVALAPDIAEALHRIVSHYDRLYGPDGLEPDDIVNARTVLARARGES